MATKNSHDAAKKKTAKEKKMLVGLIVVLVLALGYAYKTMTKLHGSAAPTQVVAASSTTTPSAAASTTPATPAASSSSAPVDVPSSGASAPSGSPASNVTDSLVSAVTPPLDQGELKSFTLFAAKDPFDSGGPSPSGTSGASSGSTGGTTPTQQPTQPKSPPSSSGSKGTVAAPTSAVISVNGTMGQVAVGQSFPNTGDPTTDGMFELVSLTKDTAQVAVAGGSFASGSPTLTLHVGRPVTLQNTADGTRYTLELFPQGTAVPVSTPTSSSSSSSSAPPATSTTTATTPTS